MRYDAGLCRYWKMAGSALAPPLGGPERLERLGELLPADIEVEGNTFKASSRDVAVAGPSFLHSAARAVLGTDLYSLSFDTQSAELLLLPCTSSLDTVHNFLHGVCLKVV